VDKKEVSVAALFVGDDDLVAWNLL
jgi:hypothetical protein